MNGFGDMLRTKFSIQIFQRAITPLKIIEPEQDYNMHNQAWYLSILQSFIEIRQRFWRNAPDKIFNANISKCHNSAKNHRTGTGLRYAQLGMVLINPTKFHQNPTKGFGETLRTKFSMQIFQSPITPPKIIKPEQDYNMHNQAWYLSILLKFHQNPTKGFGETAQTKFSMEIFQSPITP